MGPRRLVTIVRFNQTRVARIFKTFKINFDLWAPEDLGQYSELTKLGLPEFLKTFKSNFDLWASEDLGQYSDLTKLGLPESLKLLKATLIHGPQKT